ncbi:DUF2786 domain-containing protein [Nocardia sp. NPDC050406]|uniref:DUF2786 domain-containing protein n=1 Tax=Nocardia sp. NPDC050406 TaxID=3364318 RepID=UPI0037ADC83E
MGKPNRKHRAAKQRARLDGAGSWAGLETKEQVSDAIAAAAVATARAGAGGKAARGDSALARQFAAQIAAGTTDAAAAPDHGAALDLGTMLGDGVDATVRHIVALTFQNGWLPMDVVQAARRRTDEFAVGFLVDAIAGHVRPFTTLDEMWREQIRELEARVWWAAEQPHFSQWADKHLLTREEALATVIEALALLVLLPEVGLITPLPGTARPHATHHIDAKVLGRVRGLLAKAESTDFPEEAETLSAKAQELMTKYALDRALLDADNQVADVPGARRIWLDTPYTDAKAMLLDAVARANRSRAIFVAEWGFVTVVGDDADLDAIELLSTSLLVQATRAMVATGEQYGDEARSRTFRKAFLVAYATRIGERLAAATAATIAESPAPQRLLPVLASHQLAVDTAFETLFPHTRSRGVTIRSAEGWDAGRAAADRARLDT